MQDEQLKSDIDPDRLHPQFVQVPGKIAGATPEIKYVAIFVERSNDSRYL